MKNNLKLILLFILFSIISGFYIYNHRLDLNPDGISYIDIAKLYKSGNFHEAINAYWSPVFSWILLILNFTGDWLNISKIVIFISSLFWFVSSYLLFKTIFHDQGKIILGLFIITIFPGSYEIWRLITPDLIFTGFVNVWMIFLLKTYKTHDTKKLFYLGLFSGIGFLIKSYFLFFSLILIFLLLLFKFISKKDLLFFSSGIIIIPIFWAFLIYGKYGHFSFGTTFIITYKHHVQNQEFIFLTKPMPYPEFGTSFWTDPSDFSQVKFDLSSQITAVENSLKSTSKFLLKNFHLGLILIVVYILKRKYTEKEKLLLLFIILWIAIYSLIYIEPRYLWPILVPLYVILLRSLNNNFIIRFILISYLIISVVLFSTLYLKNLSPDPNSSFHIKISQQIKPPCVLLSDVWARGLYIAYLSGCKYYGITQTAYDSIDIQSKLLKEIQDGKVTHFLTFNYGKYKDVSAIAHLQNSGFNLSRYIGLYKIKSY